MKTKTDLLTLYWRCQLGGWMFTALFWSFQAYFQGRFSVVIAVIHLLLDMAIGIGITHGYRAYVKKRLLTEKPIFSLTGMLILSVVLMSVIYMLLEVLKNYALQWLFNPGLGKSFGDYFMENGVTLLVTGIRLLAIWVLIYHLFHYAHREIRIIQEHAQLSVMAKEAQLANLHAQLNPHCLFNSLNNIKALVLDDPASARRGIDLLSELLRNSLYNNSDRLVTIMAEMELVRDYLELETLRFEERLQYKFVIDEQAATALIPLLSIQGLVENAIKHGIDPLRNGGLVEIAISRINESIVIRVCNSGVLHHQPGSAGIGLRNLKERMALQFNGLARFELCQQTGDTVSATLTIPHHG